MQIPFNNPYFVGKELEFIKEAINNNHISGDGIFTKRCQKWLEEQTGCRKALLTHSCTAALEMAAILSNIQPGDEIIMPSYTFVSTANAFVLRGGVPVFVDVRPDTMNIDETQIVNAITAKTRAIVPVHYAGVACEMETILAIAEKYNLLVIEDAAQSIMCSYKGKPLGSIGHIGTISFHETKNITSGEGGALLINDTRFIERAEIIREKGTNRSQYFRGEVDKYSWVDIGSSYLPSDITAAFLYAQMEVAAKITAKRLQIWEQYYDSLMQIAAEGLIDLPFIPEGCIHNAHMFYLKIRNLQERTSLINYLKKNGIHSVFHYIPLHSSEAGIKFSRFSGKDRYTTKESDRVLRLPLFYKMDSISVDLIVNVIKRFLNSKRQFNTK